jgi:hypothetical protein
MNLTPSLLYRFLPDKYKLISQPSDTNKKALLTAIIEALSQQDENNYDLLAEARKQLFLNSATGKYLLDLAAQQGFNLPQRSGFDQSGISKLVIPVVNKSKQLLSTVNSLTEVVYAASTLHSSFFTTLTEPFSLIDGDNLLLKTDSAVVEIIFRSNSFNNLSSVTASELAGYINGSSQDVVLADTLYDRDANARRLRISGKTYGSSARLQCIGGTAQNILQFPDIADTYNRKGTTWVITKPATYSDITTFTWDGNGINPQTFNLNLGDYCSIRCLSSLGGDFHLLNGTYQVTDCGADYFTIKNSRFTSLNSTYVQASNSEIVFTKSQPKTLYDNDQYALVYEPSVGALNMSIPPVPSIVRRDLKGAAHLHGASYPVLSFTQNSVTVPWPNTLPASGVFVLRSDNFAQEFTNRYYSYSSVQAVTGNTQSLSLSLNGYRHFPFLSDSVNAPVKAITDPIHATLDSNIYEISTPGVNLYMESNVEFTLSNVQFYTAPTPTSNNTFTVNSILLPTDGNSVEFTHDRNSKFLYMQFRDSNTGEIIPLAYRSSSVNPLNATVLSYGNPSRGRTVSATMVVCQTVFPAPVNEATLTLKRTLSAGTGNITINHNMNSTNMMFMVMNADTGAIINAERRIIDANNVLFSYVNIPAAEYAFLFINMDAPAIAGVDTNPRRYKNIGVTLLASQTSVTINHSLRASNVIAEVRKTGGIPTLVNGTEIEFIRATFVDQDTLRINYLNLLGDLTVDLFLVYDSRNISTESVDGGLVLSDINNSHVTKRVISKDRISFEINNPDGTPKNYQGAIITGFNVFSAVDPNGDYDAYLQFGTSLSRLDAKIANGSQIRLVGSGSVSQVSAAASMRSRYLSVVSQSNDKIFLRTGVPVSTPGLVIAGEKCRSSCSFGGLGVSIVVDPLSLWNSSNVYSGLRLELLSGVQSNGDGYVGSYVYDPIGTSTPYVLGGSSEVPSITFPVQLASSPGSLLVDHLEGFSPLGGYLCLDYGSDKVEGPIRYFGVSVVGSNPLILIDSAYVFKNKHNSGTRVYSLRSNQPYEVKTNGSDYPSYLTGSTEARNAFVEIIKSITASGVVMNIEVQQPNLKNEDSGIPIF